MDKVTMLKELGNAALSSGKFQEAIDFYSLAISQDQTNHVLYSNRSAAHAKAGNYAAALEDANKTVELNPKWSKGYSRKGSALAYLGRYDEAIDTYEKGLQLEPNNEQLKAGLAEVDAQASRSLPNPFRTPDLFIKLRNNPTTKAWLDDPEYLKLIQDPNVLTTKLHDPRVMTTLSILLGLDAGSPMETDSPPPTKRSSPKPETSTNSTSKASDNTKDLPENKRLATKEKELGNDAYKKKDFGKALQHYSAAIEHDPTDITYFSNKAAVHFELKEYELCIKECEKGIEIGRENRADFKLISKAFTRIGNAYKKLSEWKTAKTFYEKSMSEHRTPEIKTLLSEIEKKIKEEELKAYVDPSIAEEEKEKGNELFKLGDFSNAVKHYTEAIKRNPSDPKLYSNRAACYTKLAAFDLGLKDCEMCCKLDDKFIKGFIRKGKILQGMQQAGKALSAYQKALEIDPNNAEALEGYRACALQVNSNPEEVRKRAMADPEIQSILRDPAMRLILDQMQQDPKALHDHLKNPEIAAKIQKLLESGLIAIH